MSKLVHEKEDGPLTVGYLGREWLLVYPDRKLPDDLMDEVLDQATFLEKSEEA